MCVSVKGELESFYWRRYSITEWNMVLLIWVVVEFLLTRACTLMGCFWLWFQLDGAQTSVCEWDAYLISWQISVKVFPSCLIVFLLIIVHMLLHNSDTLSLKLQQGQPSELFLLSLCLLVWGKKSTLLLKTQPHFWHARSTSSLEQLC